VQHWPISSLPVPTTTLNALANRGIQTIGALDGLTELELLALHWLGKKGIQAIVKAVADLETLPDTSVFRRDVAGLPLPPNAPLDLFRAIQRAVSPAEEACALVAGLSDRDAQLVRLRWARRGSRQLTLEELAGRYRITRERVRQIVDRQEARLIGSNLWLPRFASVAGVIAEAGGALPTHELESKANDAGTPIDSESLSYLQTVGDLGLCPLVMYSDEARLWLTEEGRAKWLPDGHLAQSLKSIKARVRLALRQSGCIALRSLTDAPFGARHALSIALPGARLQRRGHHLVPTVPSDSIIATWTEQMLSISPELPLSEVLAGLARGYVVHRGHRGHIEVPPAGVLADVLARDPRFIVEAETLRLAAARPRAQVLTPTEEVVVNIIEAFGDVATWAQIMDGAKAAGCAQPTVSLVLAEPFIARRGAGIYALRGRTIAPKTLRERIRERSASRRESIKRVSFSGGSRARVVYQLTNFSVGGVLPVPLKMRNLARRTWKARVPGGRELKLKMGSGFLWSLHRWFAADGMKVGDLVVADFDISNGEVHLDVAS
jgi:hypothetical protein